MKKAKVQHPAVPWLVWAGFLAGVGATGAMIFTMFVTQPWHRAVAFNCGYQVGVAIAQMKPKGMVSLPLICEAAVLEAVENGFDPDAAFEARDKGEPL